MKQTKTEFIKFTKVLTNDDILTYAKNIGEIRKKIDEAEAAKNKLRGLNYEMEQITKILEQGEISEHCRATFSFHDPEENMVTITPPSMVTRFEPIIREMTFEEKEKYCQHTLEFEEPEEDEETDQEEEANDDDDDGLYIDNYRNQVFYVRPKNDKSKLLSYYHSKEQAERFIELYKIHKDDAKVREIILNESKQPEHLLNSTGDYDMIENEDGSVSARIKEESDK